MTTRTKYPVLMKGDRFLKVEAQYLRCQVVATAMENLKQGKVISGWAPSFFLFLNIYIFN